VSCVGYYGEYVMIMVMSETIKGRREREREGTERQT
jgi:hypothetical protein